MRGPYFVIDGEDVHLFLPVGMDSSVVCKHMGFIIGLQFVFLRSLYMCNLVTVLSKIKEGKIDAKRTF